MSGNIDHTRERVEPEKVTIPGKGKLRMTVETSHGTLVAILWEVDVKNTIMNYLGLLTGQTTGAPYYDGRRVERVVPDYLVVFGTPGEADAETTAYCTREEVAEGQTHDRPGMLTQHYMARDQGGAEICITLIPSPWMDRNHTIFGEIVEGLDIVQEISRLPAQSQRPVEDVVIQRVTASRK